MERLLGCNLDKLKACLFRSFFIYIKIMEEKDFSSELSEYVKKLERGEKIPLKRTKMRIPYKANGEEDWDNAEVIEVRYE